MSVTPNDAKTPSIIDTFVENRVTDPTPSHLLITENNITQALITNQMTKIEETTLEAVSEEVSVVSSSSENIVNAFQEESSSENFSLTIEEEEEEPATEEEEDEDEDENESTTLETMPTETNKIDEEDNDDDDKTSQIPQSGKKRREKKFTHKNTEKITNFINTN